MLAECQSRVVQLYNHFKIQGPHGYHICMVFEVLGPNLLKLMQHYSLQGIPLLVVKKLTKQILQGLYYLHENCGIIHTDLKPENILLCLGDEAWLQELNSKLLHEREKESVAFVEGRQELSVRSPQTPPVLNPFGIERFVNLPLDKINVKLADLGNACWTNHHFTRDIQTRQYRSPEVVLGADYDCSADIWSCACLVSLSIEIISEKIII